MDQNTLNMVRAYQKIIDIVLGHRGAGQEQSLKDCIDGTVENIQSILDDVKTINLPMTDQDKKDKGRDILERLGNGQSVSVQQLEAFVKASDNSRDGALCMAELKEECRKEASRLADLQSHLHFTQWCNDLTNNTTPGQGINVAGIGYQCPESDASGQCVHQTHRTLNTALKVIHEAHELCVPGNFITWFNVMFPALRRNAPGCENTMSWLTNDSPHTNIRLLWFAKSTRHGSHEYVVDIGLPMRSKCNNCSWTEHVPFSTLQENNKCFWEMFPSASDFMMFLKQRL